MSRIRALARMRAVPSAHISRPVPRARKVPVVPVVAESP